jgi:outer membrane protein TolC
MLKLIVISSLVCITFLKGHSQTQTLDYYLKQGLQNSPLLKDYQNQINTLILDSSLIRATKKPQVDARAQLLFAPSFRLWGYDEAITNGGNYTSVIEASQSFFIRKALKNKYESLNIQKNSISNTSKISRNELKRLITNQYVSAYADYNDLQFNKTFLQLMNDEEYVIKKLVENAIYKQTDYLSLLIEKQTQEILVKQLTAKYIKDILTLNQLCGSNDTSFVALSLPSIEYLKPVDLSKSPLLMQYKIDSLAIVNQRSAIDAQYQPKLNWFADAGLNTSPIETFKHFGFSAGVNFIVPIYDGRQKRLQYQKFTFSENTRSNYETFFKNQYNQQIRQLDMDLTAAQEITAQLDKQLTTANELIILAKAQLNNGNMQIADFINALKNYHKINRDLNQSRINTLQIINELNYLRQQ